MIDLKYIRENKEYVKEKVSLKNEKVDVDQLVSLVEKKNALQQQLDSRKQERNEKSKQIGELTRRKEDVSQLLENMQEMSRNIKETDKIIADLQVQIQEILDWVPNLPHDSVPTGKSEADNKEVSAWGDIPQLDFKPKTHWELGDNLNIMDLAAGAKMSGSNFPLLKGQGSRLIRALINFMLDIHLDKHGYKEIWPPYLVRATSMYGTGQLPKLREDMYYSDEDELFLIPTAEVPLTNIHRDEILPAGSLPLLYTAWTPCFRREAGSYGKDTRGILRVHQFDKVEMVQLVYPEKSYEHLEMLRFHAEEILRLLELPYRVIELCTADLSFAAAKCYDLEVYAAGVDDYLEVSSCSNFEDFQARRANIRFKRSEDSSTEYVHTLNASGLALPRTVIALMENNQLPDGRIRIPPVLVPYMGAKYIE